VPPGRAGWSCYSPRQGLTMIEPVANPRFTVRTNSGQLVNYPALPKWSKDPPRAALSDRTPSQVLACASGPRALLWRLAGQSTFGGRDRSSARCKRSRTQKCHVARRWAELLGFPQYFRTRDFSRRPIQIAPG
jgi:hypothetical protein